MRSVVDFLSHVFVVQDYFDSYQQIDISPREIGVGYVHQHTTWYIDSLFVGTAYTPDFQKIFVAYKYEHHFFHVSFLQEAFFKVFKYCLEKEQNIDTMICIYLPHYWTHSLQGRLNPSYVFAKKISKHFHIPLCSCLKKRKKTQHQAHLSLEERKRNIFGSIEISQGLQIQGKHVIVIDDVCSTGSTVNEVAKNLKKQGASRVSVCVLASNNYLLST